MFLLLPSQFTLEVCLFSLVHIDSERGSVAADVLPQPGDDLLRARQRFLARDVKINGGFRERAKEVFLRKEDAENSCCNPQNQRAVVGTCQTVSRHANLPFWDTESSLYRYG